MKRKCIAIVLPVILLALCLCPAGAVADLPGWTYDDYSQGPGGTTADGWEYILNPATNTMAVTGYHGTAAAVTVPDRIAHNGGVYDVEVIMNISGNSSITEIVIPGGVRSLGDTLFYDCPNLLSVTVPASVTDISQWAFSEAGGNLVIYGNSGTPVEAAARRQGVVFAALDLGETVEHGVTTDGFTYMIKGGEATVTGYTGGLASLTLPAQAGGCPVTAVGRSAFRNSELLEVTVPEGVVSLGAMAFFNAMSLTNLTLPSTLRSVGEMGLSCCDSLASLVLPEGLVSLGDNAIGQCNSLTAITVPSTLTEAGVGAFSYVPAARITLPEGVTAISDWLFFGSGLTGFTVPGSVTAIGENAFTSCYGLRYVVIPADVTGIDARAFVNDELGYNPDLILYGYQGSAAERHASQVGLRFVPLDAPAASLILPDHLTTLDQQALAGTAAENVYVPASCAAIGGKAFEHCANLRAVHIAGAATAIAPDAFDNCPNPVVICAPAGSAALRFAQNGGMPWIAE